MAIKVLQGTDFAVSHSDAIKMRGENKTLTEKMNEVENEIPTFTIVGNGDTYVQGGKFNGIKVGNTYRVWIKNPDVDMTGIASSSDKSRLSIIADLVDGSTENIRVWNTNTGLPEYYDFAVASNVVAIHIGGRCAVGSNLGLYIEDIDSSIIHLNELINDKDNVVYNFATPYSIIQGKCIRSNGAEYANSSRYATDYIDISSFSRLVYTRSVTSGNGLSVGAGLCFYDTNKTAIAEGFIDEIKKASYLGYIIQEATIPEGAVYARFTGWIKLLERGQFWFGDPTSNPVIAKLVDNKDDSINMVDGTKTFFIGAGSTYVLGDEVLVGSNQRIIKCVIRDTDFPRDDIGTSTTLTLFAINAYDSNLTQTNLLTILISSSATLEKEHIVILPEGTQFLKIGGRCNSGYKVYCDIFDITDKYPIKHTANANEFCIYSNNTRGFFNFDLKTDIIVNVTCKNASTSISHVENYYTLSDEHVASGHEIHEESKRNVSLKVLSEIGEYIGVLFKGTNLTGQTILDDYDINIYSTGVVNDIESNEKELALYGSVTVSNHVANLGDFITKLKETEKLRIVLPSWLTVAFYGGKRTDRTTTSYYYDGDIVELGSEKAFIVPKIKRLDTTSSNGRYVTSAYVQEMINQNKIRFLIQDVLDGSIIERNFDAEKYAGAIKATPNKVETLPTIVHTSDTHGDAERLLNVHEWADYIGADIVINTGDNPFYLMGDGVQFVSDVVKSHKTDFANCLGNHDTYDEIGGVASYTQKNIEVFAEDYHYCIGVEDSAPIITDKGYYYKDLSNINIRLIAINLYDDVVTANYKARVSSTQMQWFIDTLLSTPANYGVIVIMHQVPHTLKEITGKISFNDTTMNKGNVAEDEWQCASIDSDYMTGAKLTGNPFGKIIDAFISKTSVSGVYNQKNAAMTESETVSYSADFTNVAEGVEFIMYLNGHTHRDFVGYVADCVHNQLNINVGSTSPIAQSTGIKSPADIFRDTKGANQDAFNIYTINRTDKTVGIARIGANLSKNLVDRKVMFVSYADSAPVLVVESTLED